MAAGDGADFRVRLRALLPLRWFPDTAPVLDGVLAGLAAAWAAFWDNLQFVRAQTRIATATGAWLDAVAADFFAGRVARGAEQDDAGFRAAILAALVFGRGTRGAMQQALQTLTGQPAAVWEPVNVRDTGAWGGANTSPTLFYGAGGPATGALAGGQGGWGNIGLNAQALVTAELPTDGRGVAEPDIFATAVSVLPCAALAWVQVPGAPAPPPTAGLWDVGTWDDNTWSS